jgi:hypothetical protein
MHLAANKITIMANVLLPTDLTIQSLYPIHEICRQAGNEPCNIHVIHTLSMPAGIMDLLFLQGKKPYKMLSPSFLEAMDLLRGKYSAVIGRLSFEFLWGHSRGFLRNYMEARDIQTIYMLKEYEYKPGLPESVDCRTTLHKCQLPVVYVQKKDREEYGTLTTLLYRERKIHVTEKV